MFKNYAKLKKLIDQSPQEPGVYIFFGTKSKVLYVGKANKLKTRLKFYIDKNVLKKYPKTKKMVSLAVSVKYFTTNTEAEALILEANLIKKYAPKYNTDLKDGKNYKLIEILKDSTESYKIKIARKKTNPKSIYFGPYPSASSVSVVLKTVRKILPYRDCTVSKFNYYKKLNRPCLYGYLNLCNAPCQSSTNNIKNTKSIKTIKSFLNGQSKVILKKLYIDMQNYSKELNYEEAAVIKKKLDNYAYISAKYKNEQELLEGVGDVGSEDYKILELLNILSPYFVDFKKNVTNNAYVNKFRIEFFDISNLSTQIIVGASTCIIGGRLSKEYYRKYKIKNSLGLMDNKQNDFSAINQIVKRRLNNIKKWGRPNLIVIDGGIGQLSSALKVTTKYNIPTISLAKKNEEIYIMEDSKSVKIKLPKNNSALNVLIKGRNEVHRFGITYNKSLRKLT